MTRKRFIKLYISYGYSRDEANLKADVALLITGCYKTYYNGYQSIAERHTTYAMKGTVKAWQAINNKVQTIVQQAADSLEAPLKGIAQALRLM
jgi:hypothetical protein